MSLQSLFTPLQSAFDGNDLASVGNQLPRLKLALTKEGLLFPTGSSHSEGDLVLARSTLEIGAFHSMRTGNIPAFERYLAQLETFYSSSSLPPSPHRPSLLALTLLTLLSTSRTSAFHTLLESTQPSSLLSEPKVAEVVELERGLMEGRYQVVWGRAKELLEGGGKEGEGGEGRRILAEQLVESIRNQIALSFPSSYTSLPFPSAQNLLFLSSPSEVTAFVQKRGWSISPSSATIFFPPPGKGGLGGGLGAGGMGGEGEGEGYGGEGEEMKGLIVEVLGYARELEAIV